MWRRFLLFLYVVVAVAILYSIVQSSFIRGAETDIKKNFTGDVKSSIEKGLDDALATLFLFEVRYFLIGAGSLFLFLMAGTKK